MSPDELADDGKLETRSSVTLETLRDAAATTFETTDAAEAERREERGEGEAGGGARGNGASQRISRFRDREDHSIAKANEAIAIRPRRGRLTLLSRRIYNALLYHAQRQGVDKPQYQLALSELIGDARFNSNNTELLKSHLRDMQATTIEWSTSGTERRWVSTQLIGTVKIEESGRGRPTVITWCYPEEIRERLVKPRQYTRVMLEMSAQMRSYAAAVLYEIGARYLTSPSRLTMREDLIWWAAVLTGRSDIKTVEYRFLKRDVLSKAMGEVDTFCDEFSLELIEHKRGRKIEEIQFRVVPKAQKRLSELNDPTRNVFDLELVGKLVTFGFKQDDAQDLYATTDEGALRAAIAHVEQRIANATLPTLRSSAAYLRDALRRGYPEVESKASRKTGPPEKASTEDQRQRILDAWHSDRRQRAKAMYGEMDESRRAMLRGRFEASMSDRLAAPILRAWRRDGPDSAIAGSSFFSWLAVDTWPEEPSDEALLRFALNRGQIRID